MGTVVYQTGVYLFCTWSKEELTSIEVMCWKTDWKGNHRLSKKRINCVYIYMGGHRYENWRCDVKYDRSECMDKEEGAMMDRQISGLDGCRLVSMAWIR